MATGEIRKRLGPDTRVREELDEVTGQYGDGLIGPLELIIKIHDIIQRHGRDGYELSLDPELQPDIESIAQRVYDRCLEG